MKICFVQPNTDYQIQKNRHALALTFPTMIVDMQLETADYCIYVEGKCEETFDAFLEKTKPTHVLITAITSTFPYALSMAQIAKKHGCIVAIGGIFPSVVAPLIEKSFHCFDYIVSGYANAEMLDIIRDKPDHPTVISARERPGYGKRLGSVITDSRFRQIYPSSDNVCYELANGCKYNCSFCSMRRAFPDHRIKRRGLDVISDDLSMLKKYWHKLKLIDDDICNSSDLLAQIDFGGFDEIIAETRLDNITDENMRRFQAAGITHLIVGVESFDTSFLRHSRKTPDPNAWEQRINQAIELFIKYNIVFRPVVMITNAYTTINGLEALRDKLTGWQPKNNVQLLCSFFTPHPGMYKKSEYSRLLTYHLSYFDHLHCVWLPPMISVQELECLSSIYGEIVKLTESEDYNPMIDFSFEDGSEFSCFFE